MLMLLFLFNHISEFLCMNSSFARRLQKIAIFVDDIAKNYTEEFNDGPVSETIEKDLFPIYY